MNSKYACSYKGIEINSVIRQDGWSRYYIIIDEVFEGKQFATITDCEDAIRFM